MFIYFRNKYYGISTMHPDHRYFGYWKTWFDGEHNVFGFYYFCFTWGDDV